MMQNKRLILGVCFLFVLSLLSAQVVERERPVEWQQLVRGGRFMDRFLSMQGSVIMENVWGTDSVRLRYIDNGIELPETSFWGGNILQTGDGKYHMFVCGWAENSPKGHMFWPNSTVYHATSDCLHGPFSLKYTIGKGHNPEAFVLDDGRIVVYVIDGYYIADSIKGPWTYGKFDFDPRDRNIIEGLSNLTFARRQDGSYLMVCRGGGIWVSRDGLSTYCQLTDKRVYPAVDGQFEDPVVWRDSLQYHLIVNDWLGRIAYYQRSKDGVHWVTEQGEAYIPGISFHENGYIEHWFKYERPKIFQDKYGRAIQMNFAVIDTIKWNDLPNDNHSSKNICIPLNKGLQLTVLNKKTIKSTTRTIEVRIAAEEGFDPLMEIDIESLRFGSYVEVNFGKGCKPLRTRKSGDDLIVIFDGQGSGITDDEFAPKLIGRNKNGNLLFGYARLRYVDYTPSLLSARKPVYNRGKKTLDVKVENFGLTTSKAAIVEVTCDEGWVEKGEVKPLKPYEGVLVSLELGTNVVKDESKYKIEFY